MEWLPQDTSLKVAMQKVEALVVDATRTAVKASLGAVEKALQEHLLETFRAPLGLQGIKGVAVSSQEDVLSTGALCEPYPHPMHHTLGKMIPHHG